MENEGLEKIMGFDTEKGSKYRYQGKRVLRQKFTGRKEDEFDLNVFIPPYGQLSTETRSKLEKMYDIKSEFAYTRLLENLVYDRSTYRSHVFSFEDGKFIKINNDEDAEGKDIYFVSVYRNNAGQKSKIAFLVNVGKQPKKGYFPYQENNMNRDTYVYHLGDKVSEIYKIRV